MMVEALWENMGQMLVECSVSHLQENELNKEINMINVRCVGTLLIVYIGQGKVESCDVAIDVWCTEIC